MPLPGAGAAKYSARYQRKPKTQQELSQRRSKWTKYSYINGSKNSRIT
jgi:hypothetical protein